MQQFHKIGIACFAALLVFISACSTSDRQGGGADAASDNNVGSENYDWQGKLTEVAFHAPDNSGGICANDMRFTGGDCWLNLFTVDHSWGNQFCTLGPANMELAHLFKGPGCDVVNSDIKPGNSHLHRVRWDGANQLELTFGSKKVITIDGFHCGLTPNEIDCVRDPNSEVLIEQTWQSADGHGDLIVGKPALGIIHVKNVSDQTMSGVSISDAFPAFLGVSGAVIVRDDGSVVARCQGDEPVQCPLPEVGPQESLQIEVGFVPATSGEAENRVTTEGLETSYEDVATISVLP